MNGSTIQVTTDKSLIPKHFIPLDNYIEMKNAISQDMEGNNLTTLLTQTTKRKDRDEISNIIDHFEEENKSL